MKKWLVVFQMMVAAVIFAGCSGDEGDSEGDAGSDEAAAPAVSNSMPSSNAGTAAAKAAAEADNSNPITTIKISAEALAAAEASAKKSDSIINIKLPTANVSSEGSENSTGVSEQEAEMPKEGSDEKAEDSHGHSHGDGDGHSHDSAKADTLGALVASLDGSKTIEVGCGSCSYGMDGVEDCVLAAVIDDETYLVTGVEFDTHGNGLCKATKTATIIGKVHAKGIDATKVELTD